MTHPGPHAVRGERGRQVDARARRLKGQQTAGQASRERRRRESERGARGGHADDREEELRHQRPAQCLRARPREGERQGPPGGGDRGHPAARRRVAQGLGVRAGGECRDRRARLPGSGGGGERGTDADPDQGGAEAAVLGEEAVRTRDADRYDGYARPFGEEQRSPVERADLAAGPARALGEEDHGTARPQPAGRRQQVVQAAAPAADREAGREAGADPAAPGRREPVVRRRPDRRGVTGVERGQQGGGVGVRGVAGDDDAAAARERAAPLDAAGQGGAHHHRARRAAAARREGSSVRAGAAGAGVVTGTPPSRAAGPRAGSRYGPADRRSRAASSPRP